MNEFLKKTLREYLSVDHVAHFGVCYFVTTMIFAILCKYPIWSIIVGVVVSLVLGIGKEIYDKSKGGKFDLWDLWFDCLGILFALSTFLMFYEQILNYE